MWPFKKKKESVAETPLKCNHKWQDFRWILEVSYANRMLHIKIWEPYVCIYCKERKNVKIGDGYYENVSRKEADEIIDDVREKYKNYIEEEAIVEDEINDFQLVDRQWLEIAYALRKGQTGILRNG